MRREISPPEGGGGTKKREEEEKRRSASNTYQMVSDAKTLMETWVGALARSPVLQEIGPGGGVHGVGGSVHDAAVLRESEEAEGTDETADLLGCEEEEEEEEEEAPPEDDELHPERLWTSRGTETN
jgi:hypothetical protein